MKHSRWISFFLGCLICLVSVSPAYAKAASEPSAYLDQVGFQFESQTTMSSVGSVLIQFNQVRDDSPPSYPVWLWSAVLPGLGQVFMGHPTRGYFFLLANAIIFPLALLAGVVISGFSSQTGGANRFLIPGIAAGVLQVIAYIWNIYDANSLYVDKLLKGRSTPSSHANVRPLLNYQLASF